MSVREPRDHGAFVLERAGCPLHYWLSGPEGRPLVVFTHGAWLDHTEFDGLVPLVARHYRVLTWDVRAHGLSRPTPTFTIREAAADLVALLDHLGIAQATVVGHSMGGNIAQELLFLHRARVRALVLFGCTCNTLALSPLDAFLLAVGLPLLRLYPYEFLKRQSARASAISPAVQSYLYDAFGRLTRGELVTIVAATARCLHPEAGYRIAPPFLLTHGAEDGTGNIRRIAPAWAAREPHARYVVVPDAGHVAHMDNSASFNPMLLDFLREQLSHDGA